MTGPWPEVELGTIALKLQDGPFGSNLKSSHYVEDGVRVVRLQNIGVGYFDDTNQAFIDRDHFKGLAKHECVAGDVLVATLGDPIVRAAILPPTIPVALNKADCIQLRCHPDHAAPEYVSHYLNSPRAQGHAKERAHGQTRPRVNLSQLRTMPIPLPPIEEQRRIAAVLDAAEALRTKRRLALAKLSTITQAIFVDMFGDPLANPHAYPQRRLGDIAQRFSDGPFGSNLKSEHYVESGVRVIRLQNIGVDRFIDDDAAYISLDHFDALRKHECVAGDVLVGTMGDPNLRACVQPAWLPRALNKADCVQIRVDGGIASSVWLSGLLNCPGTEAKAHSLVKGQTRARISMGRLRELEVPVPPISLQLKFGERIAAVQPARSLATSSLGALNELFAALQQRAFRGEL